MIKPIDLQTVWKLFLNPHSNVAAIVVVRPDIDFVDFMDKCTKTNGEHAEANFNGFLMRGEAKLLVEDYTQATDQRLVIKFSDLDQQKSYRGSPGSPLYFIQEMQ